MASFVCEPHGNPVRPGEAFTLDQCRVCWLAAGGHVRTPVARSAVRSLPCIHEGMVVERAPCGCEVKFVRDCEKFDANCTRGPNNGSIRSCSTCDDYAVEQPEPIEAAKRHLLFHILPTATGSWRRAVDQIALRWPLFTGRKIIAVCTPSGDYELDPLDDVRDALPSDAEVIPVVNNSSLREVATWNPLWDALRPHLSPQDYIFYGHAKGATRPVDPGNSCHWWASLLYSLNLDHWSLIESQLRTHPIVGSFKKSGYGFIGVDSKWHYSGTFFWMRAGDAIGRLNTAPPSVWWGVEAWPGLAYREEEVGCVFKEGEISSLDLYNPSFWSNTIRPEYSRWIQNNRPDWPWNTEPPPFAIGS